MIDLEGFQAELSALKAAYAAELPAIIKQIEQEWNQLARGEWDDQGFQALMLKVHSLTGSGKSFGFDSISDAARNLEDYLRPFSRAQAAPNEVQRNSIEALLHELRRALG